MLVEQMYLHLSNKVYHRNFKEVWNDKLQTSQYSYVDKLQAE
jgi:hypothetical protein